MKFKNIVLGIGIVVVYALALWQGIEAFYPQLEWSDYCEADIGPIIAKPRVDNINCPVTPDVDAKVNACNQAKGYFRYVYDENGCVIDGYCDECSIKYEEAADKHSRNVFIISLILGVITIIIGFTILRIEPVGSALIGSGIWALIYGTAVNWRNFANGIKFTLLVVVLVALICFAIWLNKRRKGPFKFG